MSPEEKTNLRERGKKFVDKNLGGMGNIFGKKTPPVNNGY